MRQPELGKKIVELRKANGLTQEELVERCNISVRTIQRIESGEVTPRSYTVRTILDALGYDINYISIDEERVDNKLSYWIKEQFTLGFDQQEPNQQMVRLLNIAWVFGIIYFIAGFFEGPADFIKYSEHRMIFDPAVYIIIKILILISFTAYWRAFAIIGSMFQNYLLSVTSIIIMFGVLMTTILDIASIYHEEIYNEATLGGMGITFGVLGIIFGIALIRLRKVIGELAFVTGLLQIVAGIFFMTLVLSFVGFIVLIPAELCGIMLVYKVANSTKKKMSESHHNVVEASADFAV